MATGTDSKHQIGILADIFLKEYVIQKISEKHIVDPEKHVEIESLMRNVAVRSLQSLEKRFKLYSDQCLQAVITEGVLRPDITRDIIAKEERVMQDVVGGQLPEIKVDAPVQGKELTGKAAHTQVLRRCRREIVQNLNLKGSCILDRLLEDDVMSECEVESIIGKGTSRDRNEEFFRVIEGRCGKYTFNTVLLPAIREDHPHVADELEKELNELQVHEAEDVDKCPFCKMIDTVQVKRIANALMDAEAISSVLHADLRSTGLSNRQKWEEVFLQVSDQRHVIECLRTKYPDLYEEFKLKRVSVLRCQCHTEYNYSNFDEQMEYLVGESGVADMVDVMSVTSHYEEYKMEARPLGICMIINNNNFGPDHSHNIRGITFCEVANVDAERLKYIFQKLQFEVRIMNNLTDTEMVSTMKDMASNIDHSTYDCFVCCIISLSLEDGIAGVNGKSVPVTDMTEPFRASACPSLAGKPKLFFIQTSIGNRLMSGLNVSAGGNLNNQRRVNIIPDEADFLVNYASVQGYISHWRTSKGSWFIHNLTEILEKYGETYDLLSCLIMVNEEVAQHNARYRNRDGFFKQIPNPMFTLRKRVVFNTDPVWSESLSAVTILRDSN